MERPGTLTAAEPRTRAHDLEMVVRLTSAGPVADREAVTRADLADAYAEAWWLTWPVRGYPEVPRDAASGDRTCPS